MLILLSINITPIISTPIDNTVYIYYYLEYTYIIIRHGWVMPGQGVAHDGTLSEDAGVPSWPSATGCLHRLEGV